MEGTSLPIVGWYVVWVGVVFVVLGVLWRVVVCFVWGWWCWGGEANINKTDQQHRVYSYAHVSSIPVFF